MQAGGDLWTKKYFFQMDLFNEYIIEKSQKIYSATEKYKNQPK
jgi:hypothetical protein